jgi:ADP-ribose pyrophosphatase
MAIQPWKTLSSKLAFEHPWYNLRQDRIELPDGQILDDYFVSLRPDIAVVFAVTASNHVLFVKQFRQGVGHTTLELPAGFFHDEKALEAAQRELLEETGHQCNALSQIGCIASDASRHNNYIYSFLGTEAQKVAEQSLDPTEQGAGVEVVLIPFSEVLPRVRSGEIFAMSTVATIYRAFDELHVQGFF